MQVRWPYIAAILLFYSFPLQAVIYVPEDYDTIQQAIDAANNDPNISDRVIELAPGTYKETFQLTRNLTLRGKETARTILQAVDTNPIITINNIDAVKIYRLTFQTGTTGIAIENNAFDIDIFNNVFNLGTSAKGIVLQNASAEIVHNTFHQLDIAIQRDSGDPIINDNIFSDNDLVLNPEYIGNIANNCYYSNTDRGAADNINDQGAIEGNPLFVDPEDGDNDGIYDFHLQENSACRDAAGADGDQGAYGGLLRDGIPLPVTGLSQDSVSFGPPIDVTLSWNQDLSYQTQKYRIYYQASQAADLNSSSQDTADNTASIDITGLTSPAGSAINDAPQLSVKPSNQTLSISWNTVANAGGYELSYERTDMPGQLIDTIMVNGTSYDIRGLENGVEYKISVFAFNEPAYYFAAQAISIDSRPGELSNNLRVIVGNRIDGPVATINSIPESVQPFPDLPDEGCFIATAAYGSYSATQVQWLRDFRDQYLLTWGGGRVFVKWYYRHSPAWAQSIEHSATSRAVVRVLLLPLVACAYVLTQMTLLQQILVALLLCAFLLVAWRGLRLFKQARLTGRPV